MSNNGSSNQLQPPSATAAAPPGYDPRRMFPFGLSPIPELPSELASEVESVFQLRTLINQSEWQLFLFLPTFHSSVRV